MNRDIKTIFALGSFVLGALLFTGITNRAIAQTQRTNTDPAKSYVNVDIPKTPESAGFEKYGYAQVNEFSGNSSVAIPLYTVQSRFLQAPISLSYQASGIRVNQEASWVGLGWDLIAGGRITVETKGSVDFSSTTVGLATPDLQTAMTKIFNRLGNSRENAVLTPATFWEPPGPCQGCPTDTNLYNGLGISQMTLYGLGEPDIFRANFMGHSLTFYVDKVSNTIQFIGEKSNFKINYTLDSYQNITGWTLVDNEGISYYFNQTETTTNTQTSSPVVPSTTTSAWLLTQAVHPSGDYISFTYANYGYSVPAFGLSGSINVAYPGEVSISSDQHQNISIQSPYYLTKIETENISVDFILATRTDLYGPGSRKLSQLTVTDKLNSKIKKTVTFNYSYFQGTADANIHNYLSSLSYNLPSPLSASSYLATSNSRLRLDSVNVNSSAYQPPYRFYYHTANGVPDKYSYSQDHWGYFNGVNNTAYGYSFSRLIPYSGAYGVQNSLAPELSASALGNNRECDSSKMITLTMDSVVYPTGGSTKFLFEPHKSVMLPTLNVTGGGLRVKQMRNYVPGTMIGTREYTYTGGKYMGAISYFTNSVTMVGCPVQGSPSSIANLKYSSNGAVNDNQILIGYTTIKIADKDASGQPNGYTLKTFNTYTPSSYYSNGVGFDLEPPYFVPGEPSTSVQGFTFTNWLDATHKNLPPTPSANMEGKIMLEQYFDNSNNLLKSVNYYYRLGGYTNNFYDVKAFQNRDNGFPGSCGAGSPQNGYASGGWRAVNLFVSPAKAFYTLTDSVVEVTYQGVKSIREKKSYTYDSKYQVRSETYQNSDNGSTVISYTRPYDYLATGLNGNTTLIYQMTAQNLNSTVFTTRVMQNGVQVDSVLNLYYNASTGVYVPQNTQVQIGANPMETRMTYNYYDQYGHLLEKQKPGGQKEVYLWGYNKHFPVASVIGSEYLTISGIVSSAVLDNPSSDAALRAELNKIRTQLSGVMVTTYTYDPVYGITSVTDPNGRTSYYQYDGMGRLSMVIDDDGNVLKRFCYNFTGQVENCALYGNETLTQTFTRAGCATDYAGTTGTYTVPANKYFSALSISEANTLAQADINVNGQNYVNTDPGSGATCIPMVKSTNTTSMPYTVTFTNTSTSAVSTFSAYPSSSPTQIGQVPPGTYNIQFTPYSSTSAQITVNGNTQTGSTITFSNIVISTPLTVSIAPNSSGPCTFSMNSGFTSPTSSVNSNGTSVTGYLVFYRNSSMTAGTPYNIGTINGGCRPGSTRTFTTTSNGITWTVTVYASGQINVQSAYGSPTVNPYSTVNLNISYNL